MPSDFNDFCDEALGNYDEDGSAGCLVCLVFVAALFVSGCFTIAEVRYWIFGRTATAVVTRVQEPKATEESDGEFEIRYSFVDAATNATREEGDAVPASWGPPPQEVPVCYVPGRAGSSRIVGNESYVAVWIFSIAALCTLALLGYAYLQARRALAPHRPRGVPSQRRKRRRWIAG
jgi:hypothetical protein